MAFTMSIDLAGPFEEGFDQEVNGAKYLLVAMVTIPFKEGETVPKDLLDMGYKLNKKEEKSGEKELELEKEEEGTVEEQEWKEIAEEEGDQEELSQAEVSEIEAANQKWKQFIGEAKEGEVKAITWGVPLRSRSSKHVIAGVARVYSRFRSLGVPILRLHCDRARELTSEEFKRW